MIKTIRDIAFSKKTPITIYKIARNIKLANTNFKYYAMFKHNNSPIFGVLKEFMVVFISNPNKTSLYTRHIPYASGQLYMDKRNTILQDLMWDKNATISVLPNYGVYYIIPDSLKDFKECVAHTPITSYKNTR